MSADYDENPIPDDDDASVAERARARLAADERLDRIVRDWQEEQMAQTRENGDSATPEVRSFPRSVGSGRKPASPVQRLPWAFWAVVQLGAYVAVISCMVAVSVTLGWPWSGLGALIVACAALQASWWVHSFLELSPSVQALTEIASSSTDPVAGNQAWLALVDTFGENRAGELLNAGTGHDAGRWRMREEDRA